MHFHFGENYSIPLTDSNNKRGKGSVNVSLSNLQEAPFFITHCKYILKPQ